MQDMAIAEANLLLDQLCGEWLILDLLFARASCVQTAGLHQLS